MRRLFHPGWQQRRPHPPHLRMPNPVSLTPAESSLIKTGRLSEVFPDGETVTG